MEMKRMDVEVSGAGASAPSRGINTVTCMFIFSLSVGIVALVLGGVAIARTNSPAAVVPSITNNFPSPAPTPIAPAPAPPVAPPAAPPSTAAPPPPPPPPPPSPFTLTGQQSLLVRNSNSGSQTALYLVTFYQNDPTCTKATQYYDPAVDPLNIGLFSNPIRIDRTQSQCFPITYSSSVGVLAGSNKYLSFRQFSTANCSGPFQDTVRLILGCNAIPDVSTSALLFYKVTVVRSEVYALNYPMALGGHESFDYHAASGKFFLGNLFNQEITAFDPTLNALATRPNLAGGKGYPGVEIYTLGLGSPSPNNGDAFFRQLPNVADSVFQNLRFMGLNVAGVKADFAAGPFGPFGSPRNRVWATRNQFFGDQSTSIYGGASVIDFSQTPPVQFHFDMNPITYPAGANPGTVVGSVYVNIGAGAPTPGLPAGMLINDIAIDPDNGDAYFTDSFNCRIMKVTMSAQPGQALSGATVSSWFNTNDLCPFGFGQVSAPGGYAGAPPLSGAIISGNGISIYRNPASGDKTIVVVLSGMNADPTQQTHNALKIGITSNGSPIYNNPQSRLYLNRLGFDGARFLNPARPGDLYISSFMFNANFIQFGGSVDAKVGVQIVQFTANQLSPNVTVPIGTSIPTQKLCSPSAGPFVDKGIVSSGQAPSQTDLTIKLYDSVDCNPVTARPAVITIPHTTSACNRYTENGTSTRAFKIRCLAGEQYNGVLASSKYIFKDFSTPDSCSRDSVNPVTNPAAGQLFDSGRCTALPNTLPPLYYIAACSNSNNIAHTVTFYSDSACRTAASTAAPPSGAMAALEYPCLKISDTSSVSAGALNEALYGIGSVILWRDSASCQGTNNVNFYPNDGECVRSDVVPPNEFTPHLPNNGRGVSWRFFLKQNSQACRHGVTSMAMVYNGKSNGGELYGMCANNFQDWGVSLFRFGNENRCDAA